MADDLSRIEEFQFVDSEEVTVGLDAFRDEDAKQNESLVLELEDLAKVVLAWRET